MAVVAARVAVGNKGMQLFFWGAQLLSPHGPPISSFLRKHPHVAKRKDRDRIIEAETHVGRRRKSGCKK